LIEAGFERSDLSVLASHDSLEVATETAEAERDGLTAGLAGEAEFLGLVATASLILTVSGPWGALAAAVAGIAGGVMALEPLLDRMTLSAHAGAFARALEEGRILLWVRTSDAARVARAEAVLRATGGGDLRRLARPAREATAESA
jgi:hypothetical protein